MLERSPALSSARLPGRLLAVLIGIDAYGRGIPPLRNAVRDVQAVAQVLREAHGYETRLLLDEAATRQGILSQLASLVAEVSADTRLVIYFAGHGLADETVAEGGGPQGFLLPQDASRDDPATLLPMAEIEARLSRLPCQHLLLLLDCCFAGAFRWSKTRSFTPRRSKLYRERFERYLRDPAWQVIASAAADERALDTLLGAGLGGRGAEGENSPFAAALCRALNGAADLRIDGQPGDGVIIGSELHYYLETAFERLEQQVGRTMQKPLLWSKKERDKGQFVFLTPGRSLSLPTALELSEHNDPYRGLASYGEEHRMLFFGRTAVADALTAEVEGHELVALVGASGTGKSSLVRAGLLPRLRAKSTPAWHIEPPTRPGTTPLAMLQSLAGALWPGSPTLSAAVAGFCQARPGTPIFLCIDQVEEVVSQAASELAAFLAELQGARQAGGGQLHIVLTLRSDFEPYFAP
ncbi:MAG TPA: caspase family protein, partial [Pseudomonadota bacterium]|nr:caspase family protein [Pseudomonadota bacterium]